MATATKTKSPPEQRIILKNVSWETYERLLADHLDSSVPHFTYDQGVLEIVAPSTKHEKTNRTLATLVEVICEEWSVDSLNVGSMTYKREDLKRGFEPDTSFYIQRKALVADIEEIDAERDPPPDLIIEIDVTSPSLNKLPLYAQLGVSEVWRYRVQTDDVLILTLLGDTFAESPGSAALPGLTTEVITRFVISSRTTNRPQWLQGLRDWARRHLPAPGH